MAHHAEHVGEPAQIDIGLLDGMAERLQQGRGLFDGGDDFGVDPVLAFDQHADSQRLWIFARRHRERFGRRRREIRVAGFISGHDVQHERGVLDRSRDGAIRHQPAAGIVDRRTRYAAARRLDPDDAAAARGDTYRAAAIRPLGDRDDACRDGRGRAAARAARRLGQIPWIVGRRKQSEGRGRAIAEFRRVRLADEDAASLLQPADDRRVPGWNMILKEARSIGGADAGVRRSFTA